MLNILKIKKIYLKIIKALGLEEGYICYIAGSEKLPAPLGVKEEKELLERLMQKDVEAKNILIERNLRLVVYISKKFENSGINIEDLISIGTIGLMKAVNSYKLDKNIKLATYASRCIENEILMFLRKNNKIRTEISIDEPINTDSEGNDLSLADILGTDNDSIFKSIEESDNKKMLHCAIKKLNNREKTIMQLRYGFNGTEELTQKEVADKLGISQSYISRIEKKVINSLKKDFSI
ncbi:MAG: RNA polymerase sporulation sigma factor SigE [Clostridia bacterium]